MEFFMSVCGRRFITNQKRCLKRFIIHQLFQRSWRSISTRRDWEEDSLVVWDRSRVPSDNSQWEWEWAEEPEDTVEASEEGPEAVRSLSTTSDISAIRPTISDRWTTWCNHRSSKAANWSRARSSAPPCVETSPPRRFCPTALCSWVQVYNFLIVLSSKEHFLWYSSCLLNSVCVSCTKSSFSFIVFVQE